MKCYKYWPENKNESTNYGNITVTVTNCEEWADYTVRTLRYSKVCSYYSIR